jgi:DNA repair photolyase
MCRTAGALGRMPHLPGLRLGEMRVTTGAKTRRRKDGRLGQLPLPLDGPPRALPVLDERERGTRFLSLPVRSVLNPPTATHMPFWSLNPYVGCEFGCSYCYARRTHEWTMERTQGRDDATTQSDDDSLRQGVFASFEHDILVKSSAPDTLLRTLDPSRLAGATLVIGTATDPYQPAERRFLLTRRLLEALLRHRGLSLGLITKSPLVTRDLDLFTRLAERHELSINISLASVDAALLRRLEARSPAPHARLRALSRLTGAGLNAGLLIAPIIPGVTDGWAALAALMEAAREAGARYVAGAALRLGPAARAGFLPVLAREFPELVARYERRYGRGASAGKDYDKALQRRLDALREVYGLAGRRMG